MRTIVDIPAADIASLDLLSRRRRTSRAALIREGVRRLLREEDDAIAQAFGAWKGVGDGLEYQRALRSEWPD